MSRILTIAAKDLRLRIRDRSVLIIAFLAPLVLALIFNVVFGSAFGTDREFEPELGIVANDSPRTSGHPRRHRDRGGWFLADVSGSGRRRVGPRDGRRGSGLRRPRRLRRRASIRAGRKPRGHRRHRLLDLHPDRHGDRRELRARPRSDRVERRHGPGHRGGTLPL